MEETMFLKIVKGSTIVDAMETLSYVRQNPRNKAIIMSEPEFANGIISSDGSVIWHLEGLPKFSSGNYETVMVVEVCEDEYNAIKNALNAGDEIPEEIREKLTTTQMMEKLDALTKKIEELEAKNTELEKKLAAKGE